MDFWLSLAVFLGSVSLCMVFGASLSWALLLGFVCFFLCGLHRGFSFRSLLQMAWKGVRTSFVVVRVMLLIGCLTAVWRISGTVAFFVHSGLTVITPRSFLLVAFLLPTLFCLAFGSSFGVAGTAGVILMAMARSGGASPLMTAGAILSGAFVGERFSPASSAAILTATVAGTDQRTLQLSLLRRGVPSMALTLVFYALLSWTNPIPQVDVRVLTALQEAFRLSWPLILPAAVLLLLPVFRVSASGSIAVSCVLAALLAVTVQGMSPMEVLHDCIFGYHAAHPQLGDILSGGGVMSMFTVVTTVILSCASSGIFTGTDMLAPVKKKLEQLVQKLGLFPVTILTSLAAAGLLCNQVISIVMTEQTLSDSYRRRGKTAAELAMDLADTAIPLPSLVPWCIACSVPLATLGTTPAALPFAFYLYVIPLCTLAMGRKKGR